MSWLTAITVQQIPKKMIKTMKFKIVAPMDATMAAFGRITKIRYQEVLFHLKNSKDLKYVTKLCN